MKTLKQFINEASQEWEVVYKAQSIGKVSIKNGHKETVKARSSREAITKAGKQLGLSKQDSLAAETKGVTKK